MTHLAEADGDADEVDLLRPSTREFQTFAAGAERIQPLSPAEAMDE